MGIHLGEKVWENQQYSALNVYKRLGAETGAILEDILEWNGSFDEFLKVTHRLGYHSSSLLTWIQLKKNWFVQLKSIIIRKRIATLRTFWTNQLKVIFLHTGHGTL